MRKFKPWRPHGVNYKMERFRRQDFLFCNHPEIQYPSTVMATPLNPNDLVTLEELTISNMWEVAALIDVLEKRGILPKGK